MNIDQAIATDEQGSLDREVVGTFSNNFEKPENGGNTTVECTTFIGYVTSIVPALSKVPLSSIASCLEKPRTGSDTVDSCLTALGVPFQTQQQIYLNQPVGVDCISGS